MSKIIERNKVVNTAHTTKQESILKNAFKMAFGTMTSRVLGLLRESLLAAHFDKGVTDSWAAAFRIPNLFRRLLGEGSLSVSFIPVFVEAHAESDVRAQNLVNSLYTLLLCLVSVITLIGVGWPEIFLNFVLDPEYRAQTEKFIRTVEMAQIMFGFVFFITSYAFFMGILNALGDFFWPAMAPTFWNISMVISTLWPQSWMNDHSYQQGHQLAYGVLIGGALQAGLLIPSLIKKGFFPKMSFKWNQKDLLKVIKNMGPGLIGLGLLQFSTIVNLRFSSQLAEGTISYINYVDRLVELPLSLISVSLGTALLPVLSKLWVDNKKNEMAEKSRYYLELNLFVSGCAAVGLFVLAEPIVRLLFGYGRFGETEIYQTSLILKSYCWIMIVSSGVRVLTPAYYAIKNTWYPAVTSALGLGLHLVVAPLLMSKFGVMGLMTSTILSALVNFSFLLFGYHKIIAHFNYKAFFKNLFLFSVVALFIGLGAEVFFLLWPKLHLILSLFITFALAGIIFTFGFAFIFKNEFNRIRHKIVKPKT